LSWALYHIALKAFLEKDLLETIETDFDASFEKKETQSHLKLNPEQQNAVDKILSAKDCEIFLLDGVTGSGKTEVYLQCIDQVLKQGKQALILVPEIGLTPQTVSRFQNRFPVKIVTIHSGLNEKERTEAWILAQTGAAKIIIGTRSAVFTPMAKPGIIILDEEHDASFKQQSGFRYSARSLALVRAQLENIPSILGSATPSLETLHNAKTNRYQYLHLPQRAGNANKPQCHIIDLRNQYLNEGLSKTLLDGIRKHLEAKGQVLLFLNRRGFAPTLLCHQCAWSAECNRCDARLTLHKRAYHLRCHHCGATHGVPKNCPDCKGDYLMNVGLGTEKVEALLREQFPNYTTIRIDKDTTSKKGSLNNLLDKIISGEANILIGTQMLAKGHHFPNVTMAAILDADSGLFSTDFRATEKLAQLLIQVSGRAGRAEKPGEVFIQTHQPEHPLLNKLLKDGYFGFAEAALQERKCATLPPYSHLSIIRAEAMNKTEPLAFLNEVKALAEKLVSGSVSLLGPIPSPMEKRAGHFRALLMIQSEHRNRLQSLIKSIVPQLEQSKLARKVRWSLDVDPLDIY